MFTEIKAKKKIIQPPPPPQKKGGGSSFGSYFFLKIFMFIITILSKSMNEIKYFQIHLKFQNLLLKILTIINTLTNPCFGISKINCKKNHNDYFYK